MAQKKNSDIQFPLGGINKAVSYQKQPNYTTPDCQNMMLYDSFTGRARGGTRPGFGLAPDPANTATGYSMNMLGSVTYLISDGFKEDSDNFEYEVLGASWSACKDELGADLPQPTVLDGKAYASGTTGVITARQAYSDIDTTKAYSVEAFLLPPDGGYSCTYTLGAMFNDTNPTPTTNGTGVAVVLNGTAISATLYQYIGGVLIPIATGSATGIKTGWLTMLINNTSVTVKFAGTTLLSGTVTKLAGTRIGFGIKGLTSSSEGIVESFRTRYYSVNADTRQVSTLIAASNGTLYRSNVFGYMEAVSSNATLASDRYIMCDERTQKVYIGDYSEVLKSGTDAAISSGGVLTATSVSNWTTYGISKYDHIVTISGSTAEVNGNYSISTLASGGLTLSPNPGAVASCSYSITRGPKIYDPILNTLALWTATTDKGSVPVMNPILCRYRDRIVLAGGADYPHLWYMSRQGDPNDWDYNPATGTTGAAVAGSNAESGALGEPIIAAIPYGDDYLIFGCANSMWVLNGDPTYGGSIDNICRGIGIVGRKAWCIGPAGELIFCSRNGIYAMASPRSLTATAISKTVLPQELINIDVNSNDVFLAYDIKLKCVHVIRTPKTSQVKYHYMIDWETKSFWPVVSAKLTTGSICEYYAPDADNTAVLFGGTDGGIRRYDTRFTNDDGSNISAYVMIGPLAIGNGINLGTLTDIIAELGIDSGAVTCEVYVGTSPADALQNTALFSGTLAEGVNYHLYPRCRGMAAYIKLSNSNSSKWAFERMIITSVIGGMQRI